MDELTSLPTHEIAHRIQLIRNQRVILDSDLAAFYGETTIRFNQQVQRNIKRFPVDFMFQLNDDEFESLRLQIAISKTGRGGRRYAPYAFTEHGAIMAATLLNSPRATEISVHVVRAFLEMRSLLSSNQNLSKKLLTLEQKVARHDEAIDLLMDSMREPPPPAQRPIGFIHPQETTLNKAAPKVRSKSASKK
jgi:phage regulator Rha-like protein